MSSATTETRTRLLDDALGPRRLSARWVVCGELTLETAMHLGGERDGRVDMAALRDERSGSPLLPGTTLAGALRDALADRLAGYGEREPPEVAELFGARRGDDEGSQSPLIVFDALGRLPGRCGIEVRDGVAIDPRRGTAEEHKKFDFEVLPRGTAFPIRADLLIPKPDQEGRLLGLLATALETLSTEGLHLGARRSRGLGQVRARWAARRFDLSSPKGWLEWALSDHERPIPDPAYEVDVRAVLRRSAPAEASLWEPGTDKRARVVIDLELRLAGDLLVRSPGAEPQAPDAVHLTSGGCPVLPGTGLAGTLRGQALRIAGLMGNADHAGKHWVDRLFGPRFEGVRPKVELSLHASRLRISEAYIDGGRRRSQTRIAIDRFTGGVVEGALFEEQPQEGGTLQVRLELRRPEPGELGLVLLLVRDLLDGSITAGGAASVGRGVLAGKAKVRFEDGTVAELEPGHAPGGAAAAKIDKAIQEFAERAPIHRAPPNSPAGGNV